MATVLIGGGTGLIGMHLSHLLSEQGHTVLHLSRSERTDSPYRTYHWDIAAGTVDDEAIQRADYIINLAGAGIADSRWTEERKRKIIESRTGSAALLLAACQRMGQLPRAYLSASAVGYYGDRGEDIMSEDDSPGEGFLSESCLRWETAAQQWAEAGVRTFILRTGIVLSAQGGALAKMLTPVSFGGSAYFGDGQQWYSWIHIDDIARMYVHALRNDAISGIYNGVAPNPVRNRDLAHALPNAASKTALVVPAPAFVLRLAMGEMAAVVLDSTRCTAQKISDSGFEFSHPALKTALQDIIKRDV